MQFRIQNNEVTGERSSPGEEWKASSVKFVNAAGSFEEKIFYVEAEFGVTDIVTASSFNDAWEEWLDQQSPIPGDEIPEAFNEDENLVEGYERQSNATGTGIVFVGFYTMMNAIYSITIFPGTGEAILSTCEF